MEIAQDFDIFSLDSSKMDLGITEKKEKVLYSPTFKDGKDNTYKAVLRFVVTKHNPKQPIVHKYTYWVEDATLGIRGYFDSPATVGEECPINKKFWQYYKSDNEFLKAKAKEKLSRKEQYYAYVQVVKDPQNPTLEGKTLIFRFPAEIKKMIDKQIKPEVDESMSEVMSLEPYDLWNASNFILNGKDFYLEITNQGGFNSYKTCKFLDKKSPLKINGVEIKDPATQGKAVNAYFDLAPDINVYGYKPWTDEQRAQVMKYLQSVTGEQTAEATESVLDSISSASTFKPDSVSKNKAELDAILGLSDTVANVKSEVQTSSNDLDEFLESLK